MRSVLWYVFIGSRSGETRMRLVESIRRKAKNAHELKKELGVDYSTVTHSLKVLAKNRIVYTKEASYGAKYELTPEFMSMIKEYEALVMKYRGKR